MIKEFYYIPAHTDNTANKDKSIFTAHIQVLKLANYCYKYYITPCSFVNLFETDTNKMVTTKTPHMIDHSRDLLLL